MGRVGAIPMEARTELSRSKIELERTLTLVRARYMEVSACTAATFCVENGVWCELGMQLRVESLKLGYRCCDERGVIWCYLGRPKVS